jgi:hypothetical protein
MADPPATGRDWLRGHRAALILTFDIDAESCMLAEGRRYAAHPNVMSHQAFGPLVGVPRILDMLKTEQVRPPSSSPVSRPAGIPNSSGVSTPRGTRSATTHIATDHHSC